MCTICIENYNTKVSRESRNTVTMDQLESELISRATILICFQFVRVSEIPVLPKSVTFKHVHTYTHIHAHAHTHIYTHAHALLYLQTIFTPFLLPVPQISKECQQKCQTAAS